MSTKNATASFLSSGRHATFIENNTMFYKSRKEEASLTNIGPGLYNIAYSWRTDEHYYPHRHISSAPQLGKVNGQPRSTSPNFRSCCSHKILQGGTGPGHYDKPWLVKKSLILDLSPRGKSAEKMQMYDDMEAVKKLPKY